MKRLLVYLLISVVFLLSAWYFIPRYEPAQIPTVNNTLMAELNASAAVGRLSELEGVSSEIEEYQEVIFLIQTAIELDPLVKLDVGLARAYVRMGDYYYRKRNQWVFSSAYSEATANYARALEIDPLVNCRTPIDVYYNLIERNIDSRNYNAAIRDITKALVFRPDIEGYHLLARVYHDRAEDNPTMRPDEAIADISKAIELDPNNFEYYYSRASIYNEFTNSSRTAKLIRYANAFDMAIADYAKAIELAPESVRAYSGRRMTYFLDNYDYIKAIAEYTKTIEFGEGDVAYHYFRRGNAYKNLGAKNLALADYRKCLVFAEDDLQRDWCLESIEELESD